MGDWEGNWVIPEEITLEGKLLFNGGQLVMPAYRRQGYSPLAVKLLHAAALIMHDFDYMWALVEPRMWLKGLSKKQGVAHHERGVVWTDYYPDEQDLFFLWSDRRELLRSLTA